MAKQMNWTKRLTVLVSVAFVNLIELIYLPAFAQSGSNQNIGDVANHVLGSMSGLAKLITASSYVAGMGFAIGAILKFKAHKDNPTQIPVGTPIALLFISAALIFLPTLFGIAGQTLFGTTSGTGGITGVTTF